MNLDPNQKHFAVSAGLTIILGLIVTALLQLSTGIAVYLFYYYPLILLFLYLEYFTMWKGRIIPEAIIAINVTFLIVAGLLFFLIYFLMFYSSQKYTFEPATSCKVIGSMSPNFRGAEHFSILYVDMVYQGKSLLGYGCISSESQGDMYANLQPSQFYERDESFGCPPNKKGPSYDLSSRRMVQQERKRIVHIPQLQTNPRRILRTSSNTCTAKYEFSNVKIPSWMCLPIDTKWDNMLAISNCKVAMYNDEELAWKAAERRDPLRLASNFAMVILQDEVFYPKLDYSMLVIFGYLPTITSCIWIFYFVAQSIPSIKKGTIVRVEGQHQKQNSSSEQEQQEAATNLLRGESQYGSTTSME